MALTSVKALAIRCLENGDYLCERRSLQESKNWLATDELSAGEVADLIESCRRHQYHASPHHQVEGLTVHLLEPVQAGMRWYIKFYFIESDEDDLLTMFISVHPSEY